MNTNEEELYASLRATPIPEYMQGGLVRYIVDGTEPGGFLQEVLNNDLREACARADDNNRLLLFEYISWLYNHAPTKCWGYDGAVKDWCGRFG